MAKQESWQEPQKRRQRLPEDWKKYFRLALIVIACAVYAFNEFIFPNSHRLTQPELLAKARAGQVQEVRYDGDQPHLVAILKGDKEEWEVDYPKAVAGDTLRALYENNIVVKPASTKSVFGSLLSFVIYLMWAFLIFRGLGYARQWINKWRGKGEEPKQGLKPKLTLDDVKGMPEVVAEMRNYAEVLKDPKLVAKLGARFPTGVVIHGEPGTGKTMMAKAFAGHLGVPFFELRGSGVRTRWIGDAAKNIAKLFRQARAHPLSVMLLDEGDTLGGRRTDSDSGGSAEHRAMVNELLTQMNPDQPGGHVFVIIVTNHPNMLDEALTRSGRIDMKLAVLAPDIKGREEILRIHTRRKPIADDVNFAVLAKEMYGFTGADIEALANNAALQALKRRRKNKNSPEKITMADFNVALVITRAGPALTSKHVTQEDRRVTAYHEGGHGLVAAVLADIPNPTSITILPHGHSGGHTMAIPDEEIASQYTSRSFVLGELTMLMAGLAAEKLALNGDYTTGTFSDRRVATAKAYNFVRAWGMGSYNASFDPKWDIGSHIDKVFEQVEVLLDEAEARALTIILQYKSEFDRLVAQLLEKETLRAEDLEGYRPEAETNERFEELKTQHHKLFEDIKRSHTTNQSLENAAA